MRKKSKLNGYCKTLSFHFPIWLIFFVSFSIAHAVPQKRELLGGNPKPGPEIVDQLDELIRKHHVSPFWLNEEATYDRAIDHAKKKLADENLGIEHRIIELLKILAVVGDGHSGMARGVQQQLLGFIPVRFAWFGDELRLMQAPSQFNAVVGGKVLAINGMPIDDVTKRIKTVVPHANIYRFRKMSPFYFQIPGILYGLDIINDPAKARIEFERLDGKKEEITFERMTRLQLRGTRYEAIERTLTERPLYMERRNVPYWYEYLEDDRLLYFKYNRISSDDSNPIEAWAEKMWNRFDELEVDKLVIDVRGNGGGGFEFSMPIVQGVLERPEINRRGKLFVLTDELTFSAATDFVLQLESRTCAILMGTQPCSGPNCPGDTERFELGETGIVVDLSQINQKPYLTGDRRTSIDLDVTVENTWDDFFNARDQVMDAVKKYRAEEQSEIDPSMMKWVGRYNYTVDRVLTIERRGSGLQMNVGPFFQTPLYPAEDGRFNTEIVGLQVGLAKPDQVEIFPPEGMRSFTYQRINTEISPTEMIVAGKFDDAKRAYQEILKQSPSAKINEDADFATLALFVFWQNLKAEGRAKANEMARQTLQVGIDVLPEAPISRYKMGLYR